MYGEAYNFEPTSDIRESGVWKQISGLKLIPKFELKRMQRRRKVETFSRAPT
jgi:hypothetical protein